MPSLTRFYGLLPRDIEEMTLREVVEYRDQMAEYQAAAEKANRSTR